MTSDVIIPPKYSNMIRDFTKLESSGGIVLVIAAILALIFANTQLDGAYQAFLNTPFEIKFGAFEIAKPLLLWINDGLMAIFFFLVGLEIKREFLEGELSSPSKIALPGIAAIGGMAAPALIYVTLNWDNPQNLNGWAIPAATDIAFALAVLSLVGNKVPASVKVLLLAIAIFDDLGAIIIIALFYTSQLSVEALAGAGVALVGLIILNRLNITRLIPYLLVGLVLWVFVLKSGVHATLAGVLVALFIPLGSKTDANCLLKDTEHSLHPWVAFGVLPIFAFANAGVSFVGFGIESLTEPVKLGISMGLFVGKQVGVFGLLFLCIALRLLPMPTGANWGMLYGVSLLTGIGFTMSLFIGSLAFEHSDFDAPIRLGVFAGSLCCALLGYIVLKLSVAGIQAPKTTKIEAGKA